MEFDMLTGKGIGVAMLDTGIFPHIDFAGRILAFQDFIYDRKIPYDDNGHGTHVAGILGGSGAAFQGKYKGVACGCNLIGIKVLDRNGNGEKESVIRSLDWIQKNRNRYQI